MKKLFVTSLILAIVNSAFTQTTYTFTGRGSWSADSNWTDARIPPGILRYPDTIIIKPANNADECILDKPQTITAGAVLKVDASKNFRVTGSLFMAPVVPQY